MRVKAPPLSSTVATINRVTPRHARRLIRAGDSRVEHALLIAGTPAARIIAAYVIELAKGVECADVSLARLNVVEALSNGTIRGKLKARVQAALDMEYESVLVRGRALAMFHEIDCDTAGTGLLADVAASMKDDWEQAR